MQPIEAKFTLEKEARSGKEEFVPRRKNVGRARIVSLDTKNAITARINANENLLT